VVLALLACAAAARAESPGGKRAGPGEINFVMHRIGTFRSEACGVADFNNDGKLDIVAGPYVYLAPDWKPLKIRELKGQVDEQGKGYYWDFANIPFDVDGDGRMDIVSCSWFEKKSMWFRNPGPKGGLWAETPIEVGRRFELADAWDLEGKGKPTTIFPAVEETVWYEAGKDPEGKPGLVRHVVSEKRFPWGVGVGDINGDGRPDIVRPGAWYEAPADIRTGKWIEHPLALGGPGGKIEHTAQIWVYDVNGDGLNDIICSSAHNYGIFWYEQVRQGSQISWKQHVIDDTWSQAHSLTLADINGDGIPELITGKRFMAHNGGDPDENGPLGLYYYTLARGKNPVWTKHVISYNEGVGAGLSIVAVDLTGSGRLDIVTTGKFGGPVWFENKGTIGEGKAGK
jgi:hypothetical protein